MRALITGNAVRVPLLKMRNGIVGGLLGGLLGGLPFGLMLRDPPPAAWSDLNIGLVILGLIALIPPVARGYCAIRRGAKMRAFQGSVIKDQESLAPD